MESTRLLGYMWTLFMLNAFPGLAVSDNVKEECMSSCIRDRQTPMSGTRDTCDLLRTYLHCYFSASNVDETALERQSLKSLSSTELQLYRNEDGLRHTPEDLYKGHEWTVRRTLITAAPVVVPIVLGIFLNCMCNCMPGKIRLLGMAVSVLTFVYFSM